MSRRRSPKSKLIAGQPRVASPVATAAKLRGGAGVHADQKRKSDPKAMRRDKSYRNEW